MGATQLLSGAGDTMFGTDWIPADYGSIEAGDLGAGYYMFSVYNDDWDTAVVVELWYWIEG